ncbi:MAG: carboxypeptidase regulatory-like domain-containing protein [Gemmatimonadetes bacterium]|nr:carboxypeptidase regulatory-like domain-containing protein [Gemmatimonadota bacterium]
MAGALALAITLGAPAARAQVITGQVVDSLSGRPVGRGFVVVLDQQDNEVIRVLTTSDGVFEIRVAPGRYRVRSERIGFRVAESRLFDIAGGQAVTETLAVSAVPLLLREIEVRRDDQCQMDPAEGASMAALWEEARKALAAAVWTADRSAYRYVLGFYERQLSQNGRRVRRERLWTTTGSMLLPFEAVAPERLAEEGYVVTNDEGSSSYFAPDPRTLLHESFQSTHCFSVVADDNLVGLAFEPVRGLLQQDVRGTLWIDPATNELQSVEFRYTGLDPVLAEQRPGGEIQFMALPSGEWVVRTWRIRMPELGRPAFPLRTRASVVVRHREVGGEVLEIADRDGQIVYSAEPAILTGTVFDSTHLLPLAGATVAFEGTNYRTTTDGEGRFTLAGPFQGEYTVTFRHPLLDSLGFAPEPRSVLVRRHDTVRVTLAIPTIERIEETVCAGAEVPTGSETRTVVGSVRDQAGRPVVDGRVTATWAVVRWGTTAVSQSVEAVALTTGAGTFALCGLPVDRWIVLKAQREQMSSAPKTLLFAADGTGVTVDDVFHGIERPIWREDLSISPSRQAIAVVTGTVTDSVTGAALAGVVISVGGGELETRSDSSGHFRVENVPPGAVQLLVRRLGYRPVVYSTRIGPGETLLVPPGVTALSQAPTELEAITVEADAPVPFYLRPFEARRATGRGHFVTREEFEKWNPTETTDVLRRTPGLRVSPNLNYGWPLPPPGLGLDTRRFVIRSGRSAGRIQGSCPLLFFLDGMRIGNSVSEDIDMLISIEQIIAIEVYRGPSETPAEFSTFGSECGVIVFWTR